MHVYIQGINTIQAEMLNLSQMHTLLGGPIWITEFADTFGNITTAEILRQWFGTVLG